MAQLIKFYKTEGRNLVYAKNNSKNHLAVVFENWDETTEVKKRGDFAFITNKAFKYVPELMDAYGLSFEIVEVSQEQESQVKTVLKALENHRGETLESESDWDDDKGEVSEINTTLCLELDNEIYIEVGVSVTGTVESEAGDYDTPPSSETTWGDICMDDLKIWLSDEVTEGEAVFNELQEQAILDSIEQLITLN
jgi:hypothetical protein